MCQTCTTFFLVYTYLQKRNEAHLSDLILFFFFKRRVTNQLLKMICKTKQILLVTAVKYGTIQSSAGVSLGENDYALTFDLFLIRCNHYIFTMNTVQTICAIFIVMGLQRFLRIYKSHFHSHPFNCFLKIFM